jgi:hypothetical protein
MTELANYVIEVLANYAYILTIWLHLVIVLGCITLKNSIMVNTRRIGSACQSNMASSMPSHPWVLSIAGITCVSTLGHVDNIESIVKM